MSGRSIGTALLLMIGLLFASPVSAEAENSRTPDSDPEAEPSTLSEFFVVGSRHVSSSVWDQRSGEWVTVEGVEYILRPRPTSSQASMLNCTVNYTVNTPYKAGGPHQSHVAGTGSVSNGAACASAIVATLGLYMDETPGGFILKESHSQNVAPGQVKNFYNSKDCITETFPENWLNKFLPATGNQYNTLNCSA